MLHIISTLHKMSEDGISVKISHLYAVSLKLKLQF